jgi:hypothetical protein
MYNDTGARLNGALHTSLPTVSVPVCAASLSLLGNDSVKRCLGNQYTRNNKRISGRVVLYAFRVYQRKIGDYFLPRTSCLLLWSININVFP